MTNCCDKPTNCASDATAKVADNSAVSSRVRRQWVFKIRGMDCAEEVAVLRNAVGPIVGGADHLSFDVLNGKMSVLESAAPDTTEQTVRDAVAKTGMRADLLSQGRKETEETGLAGGYGRMVLTAVSGILAGAGFGSAVLVTGSFAAALGSEGVGLAGEMPLVSKVLFSVGIIAGIWFVLPKAWFAARRYRPDMNFLMTLAVTGAVFLGEWLEAATVAFLFSLSLTLESWSVRRARREVAALLDLSPPSARVRADDGSEQLVPPESVEVGQQLIVKPGDRLPLDGQVISGFTEINQAPITGESVPVPKGPGAEVFAGTINGDGRIVVESTKLAGQSMVASIVRMVGEAQSRRAPSEQWVEKFAQIYTPVVMIVALLVMIVPPLVTGQSWELWFYRALILLVIACPCALVISTPVTIVAALAAAARNGVLLKGGLYVEIPARLKAIAIDKTGTLTEGRPRVVEVVPMNGHQRSELLEIAASLESGSTHPLASAILAAAKKEEVPIRPADDFQIMQGKGGRGVINGKEFWLGSHRYLEERGEETAEVHARLEALSAQGNTVVVVGDGTHVCGFIALADAVRVESKQSIQDLHRAGIKRVVMLTGDNFGTAKVVALETGIDDFRAELLPEGKVAVVQALVEEFGEVAMVGDGVNDAPAMAQATLGIAMGAVGSDAAIETADIALMSDDLSKIVWLIHHSRRAVRVIRQNIAFSLLVKASFATLALTGIASLWSAIAADMGASLLVVFNGLRLLDRSTSHRKWELGLLRGTVRSGF